MHLASMPVGDIAVEAAYRERIEEVVGRNSKRRTALKPRGRWSPVLSHMFPACSQSHIAQVILPRIRVIEHRQRGVHGGESKTKGGEGCIGVWRARETTCRPEEKHIRAGSDDPMWKRKRTSTTALLHLDSRPVSLAVDDAVDRTRASQARSSGGSSAHMDQASQSLRAQDAVDNRYHTSDGHASGDGVEVPRSQQV